VFIEAKERKMGCSRVSTPQETLYYLNEVKVKDSYSTGDVVLFSAGSANSMIIRMGTCSPYSHVGLVIKWKGAPKWAKDSNELYLWHSPKEVIYNVPNALAVSPQIHKEGPQLNPLGTYLAGLDEHEHSYVRHLRKVVDGRKAFGDLNEDKNLTKLKALINSARAKRYETNKTELFYSALDDFSYQLNQENFGSYFCSELVAHSLKEMGVIGPSMPMNEYTPADFSEDWRMHLSNANVYFTEVHRIIA